MARSRAGGISPYLRDLILFFGGFIGVAYEAVFTQADRPYLLVVFAAMMGLPTFLQSTGNGGEKKLENAVMSRLRGRSDDDEDPPDRDPDRVAPRRRPSQTDDYLDELDDGPDWYDAPRLDRDQIRDDRRDPRDRRYRDEDDPRDRDRRRH